MLSDLIIQIQDFINEKYPQMYISIKEDTFLGVKINKDNKYYMFFISYFEGQNTFSYRDSMEQVKANRISIEDIEIEKLKELIQDVIFNNTDKPLNNKLADNKSVEKKEIVKIKNVNNETANSILINEIKLSNRLKNALERNNIYNRETILFMPIEEIKKIKYLGKKTIDEIKTLRKSMLAQDDIYRLEIKEYIEKQVDIIKNQETCMNENENYKFISERCFFIGIDDLKISETLSKKLIENKIITVLDFLNMPIEEIILSEKFEIDELYTLVDIKKLLLCKNILKSNLLNFNKNKICFNADNINYSLEITEEQEKVYFDFGLEIFEAFTTMCYLLNERERKIIFYRVGDQCEKRKTLEEIGKIFGISRERVRQIIKRSIRKLQRYNGLLYYIINQVDIDKIEKSIIYGILYQYNFTFLKVIFDILHISNKDVYLSTLLNNIRQMENNRLKIEKEHNKIMKIEKRLYDSLTNPQKVSLNNKEWFEKLNIERKVKEENNGGIVYLDKKQKELQYESLLERNVLLMLDRIPSIVDIKTQSVRIDYQIGNQKHSFYPDIQILTEDGKIGIIEIKPNCMRIDSWNILKYDVLKSFCEKNGFIYGMIDDRYKNIENSIENNIDKTKEENLMNFIKNNRINYYNFKRFRQDNNLNFDELFSFIYKHKEKIYCIASPFRLFIRR